ncbi:MAG: hypothetical protein WCW87_00785 [Candidatus Paceibacterota bacterium]
MSQEQEIEQPQKEIKYRQSEIQKLIDTVAQELNKILKTGSNLVKIVFAKDDIDDESDDITVYYLENNEFKRCFFKKAIWGYGPEKISIISSREAIKAALQYGWREGHNFTNPQDVVDWFRKQLNA